MTTVDASLSELEARVARRERRSLWRTAVATLLPVTAAAALLWVTVDRIGETSAELTTVKSELDNLDDNLAAARTERDAALQQAQNLGDELETAQTALATTDARFDRLESRAAELKRTADEQQRLAETFRAQYESQVQLVDGMRADIDKLATELGERVGQVNTLQAQVTALETEIKRYDPQFRIQRISPQLIRPPQ